MLMIYRLMKAAYEKPNMIMIITIRRDRHIDTLTEAEPETPKRAVVRVSNFAFPLSFSVYDLKVYRLTFNIKCSCATKPINNKLNSKS